MTTMNHRFDAAMGDGPPGLAGYPAFPAIMAASFAALGAFGAMVLPNMLVDSVANALGLGAVSPSLVPPVEFGGRAVLAAVIAALAGACGWLVARRGSARHSYEFPPEWQTFDIAALAGEPPISSQHVDEAELAPVRSARKRLWPLADGDDEGPVPWQETLANAAPMRADPGSFDIQPSPTVGVDSELAVNSEPMDRHPLSESAESDDSPCWGSAREEDSAQTSEAPLAFASPSFAVRKGPGTRFLPVIETAELGSLGTVQLAERLAMSIARRRERKASLACHVPQDAAPISSEPTKAASEAGEAVGSPEFDSAPEALRPIELDLGADDGEVDDLGLSLPLGAIRTTPDSPLAVRMPRAAPQDDRDEFEETDTSPLTVIEFEDQEPDVAESAYGSLLGPRRDPELSGRFARIEDEPRAAGDPESATAFPARGSSSEEPMDRTGGCVPGQPIADVLPARRFDRRPERSGPGHLPLSAEMTPVSAAEQFQPDQAGTERSLRHALETLRRSGQAG